MEAQDVEESVKVIVRIRPIQKHEGSRGEKIIVKPLSNGNEVQIKTSTTDASTYRVNYCFARDTEQEDFFMKSGMTTLIDSAIGGYRTCAFAFGQTGAGKTYTMVGPTNTILPGSKDDGLIIRTLGYLFNKLTNIQSPFQVRISCLEVYHENVYDLLSSERDRPSLQIREHNIHGFFPEGCKLEVCPTFSSACALLDNAIKKRHVGEHEMNARSSRSHCLTDIYITLPSHVARRSMTTPGVIVKTSEDGEDKGGYQSLGRISLVDLAGSERLKSTNSSGKVLHEAGFINKSLYVLGKVIAGLVRTHGDRDHREVPYRDSKITKLLIGSLGGTSKTLLISCVTEASGSQVETLRTLKFSMSCALIKNRPVRFLDPQEKLIIHLREEIKRLRDENNQLRVTLLTAPAGTSDAGIENSVRRGNDHLNLKANANFNLNNMNDIFESVNSNIMRTSTSFPTIQKQQHQALPAQRHGKQIKGKSNMKKPPRPKPNGKTGDKDRPQLKLIRNPELLQQQQQQQAKYANGDSKVQDLEDKLTRMVQQLADQQQQQQKQPPLMRVGLVSTSVDSGNSSRNPNPNPSLNVQHPVAKSSDYSESKDNNNVIMNNFDMDIDSKYNDLMKKIGIGNNYYQASKKIPSKVGETDPRIILQQYPQQQEQQPKKAGKPSPYVAHVHDPKQLKKILQDREIDLNGKLYQPKSKLNSDPKTAAAASPFDIYDNDNIRQQQQHRHKHPSSSSANVKRFDDMNDIFQSAADDDDNNTDNSVMIKPSGRRRHPPVHVHVHEQKLQEPEKDVSVLKFPAIVTANANGINTKSNESIASNLNPSSSPPPAGISSDRSRSRRGSKSNETETNAQIQVQTHAFGEISKTSEDSLSPSSPSKATGYKYVESQLNELESKLNLTRMEMEDNPGDVTAEHESILLAYEEEVSQMRFEIQQAATLTQQIEPKINIISSNSSSSVGIVDTNEHNNEEYENEEYEEDSFLADTTTTINSNIETAANETLKNNNINDNNIISSNSNISDNNKYEYGDDGDGFDKNTLFLLAVGDHVEGNYNGDDEWFTGVITKVNNENNDDGPSYNISYDDGDAEVGVKRNYIRLTVNSNNNINNNLNVEKVENHDISAAINIISTTHQNSKNQLEDIETDSAIQSNNNSNGSRSETAAAATTGAGAGYEQESFDDYEDEFEVDEG